MHNSIRVAAVRDVSPVCQGKLKFELEVTALLKAAWPEQGRSLLCRPSAIVATFLAEQPPHWLKQALAEAGQTRPEAPRTELEVQHAAGDDEQAKALRLLRSWMSAMGSDNPTPNPVVQEAVSSSLKSQLSSAALAQEVCRALQVVSPLDFFSFLGKTCFSHTLHANGSMTLSHSLEALSLCWTYLKADHS